MLLKFIVDTLKKNRYKISSILIAEVSFASASIVVNSQRCVIVAVGHWCLAILCTIADIRVCLQFGR